MSRPAAVLLFVLAFYGLALAETADPMVRSAVPADGRLTLTDYGFRNWGPELVQYTVDTGRFKPGQCGLVNEQGQLLPCQIDGNVLSFVASVPLGGRATYTLRSQSGGSGPSALTAQVQGPTLVIRNELLALQVPAPAEKTHAAPIDASQAAPPIRKWSGVDGAWMGEARFVTSRKIAVEKFRLVRQGPAVVEYEARYTFDPPGEYVFRVRLSPGMPVAVVTEEFDFGEIGAGEDMLLLDLHRGWQANRIGWVPGSGEQQLPVLKSAVYKTYVDEKRKTRRGEAPVGGVGQPPAPFQPEKDMALLETILPAGRWGDAKGGVQVWDGDPAQPGSGRNMGLVPLHAGSWRRAMALCAWYREDAGMTLALPLSVRWSRWSIEVTDDHSPFSTHEHDPDLPPSYGRRCWGLYAGTNLQEAQAQFGFLGLDRYKDWTVDYAENKAKAVYPGAFFSPAQIERLKPVLDQHPDAEFLKKWYLFSGKTEDAVRHAQRVIDGLKKPYGENNFFLVGLSNYRKSQFFAFVDLAEDALACPHLPPEIRGELRRLLALYANVFSDPDANPRGAGVHLGNNNMPINRTLALSYFAGLLPDHPRYTYWMKSIQDFVQYKYATEMGVDGVNLECPSYALYSPFRTLNISHNILRNRGFHNFGPDGYHGRFLQWLSHLSMADPRENGRRIIPGMGNSSNLVENVWGFSMAAQADHDTPFAGWLRFMNRLANNNMPFEKGPNYHDHVDATPHALYFLPYIPEHREPLATTFLPTYGVAFRHQFNTPNETALLLRAGMNWGHWDTDALNVILYGKGAPLSPGTGYQYYSGPATENNAIYHNQVKLGRCDVQECFGRVDTTVTDYGFGPHADYAVGSRFYPAQIFADGQGPMVWNRHIVFLKTAQANGPSYFVMRDTFPAKAKRPSWWEWMNLDTADLIQVDGKAFDPFTTPVDEVVPEAEFPRLRGQVVEMETRHGASTWFWFSQPRDVAVRMTFTAAKETKTIAVIAGSPGEDYFYVVYPRRDGELSRAGTQLGPDGLTPAVRLGGDGELSPAGTQLGPDGLTPAVRLGGDGELSPAGTQLGPDGLTPAVRLGGDGEPARAGTQLGPDGLTPAVRLGGDGEPARACTLLGPGAVRVKTTEATDVVFVGDTPFDWNREEIVFTGKAGAVRVLDDRVVLSMNAGSGKIGYRGHVFEGHGPFERVVRLSDLKPGVHAVSGGYEKKVLSCDLGEGVTVTGEGPFTATLDGKTIRIKTSGRARVLHLAQPPFIVRPQYTIDGQPWMACWTDYPSNGWGTYDETWKIGLAVPDGEHELAVREMIFPNVWTRPFTPLIEGR